MDLTPPQATIYLYKHNLTLDIEPGADMVHLAMPHAQWGPLLKWYPLGKSQFTAYLRVVKLSSDPIKDPSTPFALIGRVLPPGFVPTASTPFPPNAIKVTWRSGEYGLATGSANMVREYLSDATCLEASSASDLEEIEGAKKNKRHLRSTDEEIENMVNGKQAVSSSPTPARPRSHR